MSQTKKNRGLKVSEEKFRTLFECAPDPYFIMDLKGTIVDGNAASETLLGFKREELIGKNMLKAGILLPAQIPMAMGRLAAFTAGRIQEGILLSLIKKDKSLVEVEIVSSYINFENRKLVLNIARDITREKQATKLLKASEKKYRDLFEKSKDAILIIENGQIVDCNRTTVKMLGYRRKGDIMKLHPSELSPEKQPDGTKSYKKADEMMDIALKKGSNRFEWIHRKANGDVFPVEVLLTAIHSDNQQEILHTVWRDISERKKVEQELQKYHNHLEELIKERTNELEKSNEDLRKQNKKLEHLNELFVGREFRIKELRDKVKKLEEEARKSKQ